MLPDDQRPVRPFDPARFVGQLEYGGATPIHVASILMHPTGEVVMLNLVGHDTAISSRTAAFFLGQPLAFIPDDSLCDDRFWAEPPGLKRLHGNYRQLTKRMPGIRNMANWMVTANHLRIGFNAQAQPMDLVTKLQREAEQQKKPSGHGSPAPLRAEPEAATTYRYVVATAGEPTPSYGAFVGTLVGMRVVLIRARQPATRVVARHWANALWEHGLQHALITPLPALGIAGWSIRNDTLAWNKLVRTGLHQGWLPTPHTTGHDRMLVPPPLARAVAAD
jgi:hypothetical protein